MQAAVFLLPSTNANEQLLCCCLYQGISFSVMQGYAAPGQLAAGIHTRLYARAYVIGDAQDKRCSFCLCIYPQDVEL